VAREPEPARRAKRRRPRLASTGQVAGRPPLLPLRFPLRPRRSGLSYAGFGVEPCGGLPARFALGAAFAFGADEHRGMQLPLIGGVQASVAGGHAPSPRRFARVE
jgi:hypothetical protein